LLTISISELLASVAPADDWQSHGEDEESVSYEKWPPYIVVFCLPILLSFGP